MRFQWALVLVCLAAIALAVFVVTGDAVKTAGGVVLGAAVIGLEEWLERRGRRGR